VNPTEPVRDVPSAPGVEGTVASAARAGVWSPGRRLLTSGLLAIVTVVAFESLAISTVMPLVESDLGDLWLYGWVFSGFFLGNLVAIVVAGRAADRMAPVAPFAVGLVLFLTGLAIGGAASDMVTLVAGRVLQGLGGGSMMAVAYVCIGRGYAPQDRPRMFALLSTAWVVPSLIGPGLAGVVGETLGWRWVFLALIPVSAAIGLVAIAAVRSVSSSGTEVGERALVGRAVAVAAGAGLVLGGIGSGNVIVAVVLIAAGLALGLPAFVALTPAGTARARAGLPAVVLTRGALTFAFFAGDAFVPFALTSLKGASAAVAGLALTAAAVVWTVGSWTQERLIFRVGPRRLVRIGLGVLAGAAILMAISLLPAVPVAVSVLTWGLAGLGIGLAYSPLSVTALSEAEPGREGAATSSLQLCDMLGTALGTGVAGAVVATGVSITGSDGPAVVAVLGLTAVMAGMAALLAGRVPRHLRVVDASV